jgi:NAD-dependent SIR2 family protein deacetylase
MKRVDVAEALKSGKKVGFLLGAGASCAAGIPDFRSPTGLYATLKANTLTATPEQMAMLARDPSNVVSWGLFSRNQFPYHEVRKPFILGLHEGKWRPTLSHFFMRVCQDHGQLVQVWSQNIDGLDLKAGIIEVVEVHGSILRAECEFCSAPFPFDEYAALVRSNIRNIYDPSDPESPKQSSNILCKACKKPGVKPATVLFGRPLPQQFFEAQQAKAPLLDVLFIVGTSLNVSPANLLPCAVRKDALRVLVNRERVGQEIGLGASARDAELLGDCDEQLLVLAEQVGWLHDLARYRDDMCEASRQLLDARLAAKK